ncbi:MAG: histidine phosphatase family protein [Chloroflexota bacterium]
MAELLLARHGQSTFNADNRIQGWEDSMLSDQGRMEAWSLAERLRGYPNVVALYSSPLVRARQTADIVGQALGLPVIDHPGLREINFGIVSGLTLPEFATRHAELYRLWREAGDDPYFRWPGGERRIDFHRRVLAAMEEIIGAVGTGAAVVITHGGSLRAYLAYAVAKNVNNWRAYDLANASLTHLEILGDEVRVIALDDRSHLPEDGRSA